MSFLRTLPLLLAAATFGACTFAVIGKDDFVQQAHSKTQTFPVAYQALYKCFVDRSVVGAAGNPFAASGPRAALYPDLGIGEYRLGSGDSWFMLIEFRKASDTVTEVRAYDLREGWLADNWQKIETCAGTVAAHLSPPVQR